MRLENWLYAKTLVLPEKVLSGWSVKTESFISDVAAKSDGNNRSVSTRAIDGSNNLMFRVSRYLIKQNEAVYILVLQSLLQLNTGKDRVTF